MEQRREPSSQNKKVKKNKADTENMGLVLAKLWSFFGNEGIEKHQFAILLPFLLSILEFQGQMVEQHPKYFK